MNTFFAILIFITVLPDKISPDEEKAQQAGSQLENDVVAYKLLLKISAI